MLIIDHVDAKTTLAITTSVADCARFQMGNSYQFITALVFNIINQLHQLLCIFFIFRFRVLFVHIFSFFNVRKVVLQQHEKSLVEVQKKMARSSWVVN